MNFDKGDKIFLKNNAAKIGIVQNFESEHAGKKYYKIFWNNDEETIHCEDELYPLLNITDPKQSLLNQNLSGYREFQKLLTYKRLDKEVPLRNNIYAYNSTRIKFYPYQFKPLIKFLDSAKNRIMICDEVGLGKTIEAGLILTELKARQKLSRILIIPPANLFDKWKLEMENKFNEEFNTFSNKDLCKYMASVKDNPDKGFRAIISLESIRNEDMIAKVQEGMPNIDLVIIDESHKMRNRDTNQWRIGKVLSNISESMLMLSATPIHLSIENLINQLNILDPSTFEDLDSSKSLLEDNEPVVKAQTYLSQYPPKFDKVEEILKNIGSLSFVRQNNLYKKILSKLNRINSITAETDINMMEKTIDLQRDLSDLNLISHIYTRTRKKDVHKDVALRKAIAHQVQLNSKEQQFYDAVTNYVLSMINEDNLGMQKFYLNMPQRRMSSSIPVMVDFYKKEFSQKFANHDDFPESLKEQFFEQEQIDHKRKLQKIIDNWNYSIVDSKYKKFIDIIKKEKKEYGKIKIIVFAFFKGTLRYLEKNLKKDGVKALRIDGDVPSDERTAIIENFREDKTIEILLSSIVGSEGIDLQFCNTIFNYDIPWNPMEMEQRIGRIDRIGQKETKIFIHNLFIKNTIEERIIKRLYDRIKIFKHAIGDLEPIIGEIISRLNSIIFSKDLSPEEKEKKLQELELAFKKKVKEVEEIESDSAKFIGTDKFFEREIDNIKKQRRYVTPKQLRIFILDFLNNNCPQTRIEYDFEKKYGYIYPDEKLKLLIKRNQQSSSMYSFLRKGSNKVKITFDSELSFDNPKLEFINILHPLVNIIINTYKNEQSKFNKASYFKLNTDTLKPGSYIFVVFRLNIVGVKPFSRLEMVILDERMEEACTSIEAESLLGKMIEQGIEPEPGDEIEIEKKWAEQAYNKCEGIFHNRAKKLLDKNKERNENFVKVRMKSLKLTYKKNKEWIEDQLRKTDKAFRKKMMKAQLEKKTNEFEEKKFKLQNKKSISGNHEVLATGILHVVEEKIGELKTY